MQRYFLHLAYHGARYSGWQRQPHASSVQQTIEQALSLMLNEATELVGCGRTDAGVHASDYVAHFDTRRPVPGDAVRRLNRLLPADIAIRGLQLVGETPPAGEHGMHARFSASHRAYRYDLTGEKDPFRQGGVWSYHFFDRLDVGKLNETAGLLLNYREFGPFCKTHSSAQTMRCDLRRSEWLPSADGRELHYHIAADRFLRGMVRLIVGACVQVSLGELPLAHVREALDKQKPLAKALSVPADGLYLTEVRYA